MATNANSRNRFSDPQSRLRAILPLLKFRAAKAAGKQPMILILDPPEEITTWERLLVYQALQVRVSTMTLRRWIWRYLESGFNGLADPSRRDKGLCKTFLNRPLAAAFVLDKCFSGWKPRAIHRALVQEWFRLSPDGSRAPSLPTVTKFIRSLVEVQS